MCVCTYRFLRVCRIEICRVQFVCKMFLFFRTSFARKGGFSFFVLRIWAARLGGSQVSFGKFLRFRSSNHVQLSMTCLFA